MTAHDDAMPEDITDAEAFRFDDEPATAGPCRACGGQGCEEGCGRCEMAYAGPASHRVCRTCKGQGR